MIVISLGFFIQTMDAGIVQVSQPHLGQVFQVSADIVVWATLGFMLTITGLTLTLGRVGDTFGRKKLYIIGMIISCLGLGLCSIAQGIVQLVIFRIIQAVGAAMIMAVGYAILTNAFPIEERGKAIGIMGAVIGAGLLVGPAVGGLLIDYLGWQSIFYTRLPIGIIGTILGWILLKEQKPSKHSGKFDLVGAAALFFTLTSLLLAINQGRILGWNSPWIIGMAIIGVLLFLLFFITEQRVAQPIIDFKLFKGRLFSIATASHMFFYVSFIAVNFLAPFYLIQGLGFSTTTAGLLLISINLLRILVSPISGRLSDKLGTLFLCALGLVIISGALFLLSSLKSGATILTIILCLSITGLGMGLFVTSNESAIMISVPKERISTASAMIATVRSLGMTIGMAIAGSVFTTSQLSQAALLKEQGVSDTLVQSLSAIKGFHNAILFALAITIICLIISLFRGGKTQPQG